MKNKLIAVLLCICMLFLCITGCVDNGGGVTVTDDITTAGATESPTEPESEEMTTEEHKLNDEEVAAMNEMLADTYVGYELPIGGWATPAAALREPYSGDPTSYDRAFQLLADSGINYMITLEEWSSGSWPLESLSSAHKAGLKLWYNCVGQSPDYSLEKINAMLASEYSEALAAIYYKDEPTLNDFGDVKAGHDAIRTGLGDRNLPVFSNLLPTYASASMVGNDYRAYVKNYITETKPDILMFDYYPYQGGAGDSIPSMMANIAIAKEEANAASIPLYTFLQSSQSGTLREPSVDELRANAHINLAMGVEGFAYFLVCEHYENWGYSHMIDASGEKKPLYDKVKTVNEELIAMKGAFLGFENKGIMLTYPDAAEKLEKAKSTMVLESFGSLSEYSTNGRHRSKAIIGCFENNEGREGYYLVNASYATKDQITLTFDAAQSFLVWTRNGVEKIENTNELTVSLDRGEGAFVIKFDVNDYTK